MTAASLPRKLRLGGLEFEVRLRSLEDMPEALGLFHGDDGFIDLRRGQRKPTQADTFLHETFHAILYAQGRDYGGNTEETYVRALATGLLAALKDNKQLANWLHAQHSP